MPDKPLGGFLRARRTKPKTRAQKLAKGNAQIREQRLKNLAKARRVRKKNLTAAKKAAKP